MKTQIQNSITIILGMITGYILNCYYYNTFDPTKFAIESKIWSTVLLVILFFIYSIVRREYDISQQKLLKEQEPCKHEWHQAKYSIEHEACILCKAERGKKK